MKEKRLLLEKNNSLFILTVVGLMLFGVAAAIFLRNTFVDDLSPDIYMDNSKYEYESMIDPNGDYISSNAISKPETVRKYSDLVVKVKIDSDTKRYFHSNYTVTKAKVTEVLKGSLNEDYINILEPIFGNQKNKIIYAVNGYYWMESGKEYVVFLRKHKDMHMGDEKFIYSFVSTLYSKYCIGDELSKTEQGFLDIEKYEAMKKEIIEGTFAGK